MADTHDTRLRWERRRAGAYRAQATCESGTITYVVERVGRTWQLLAHGPVGTRVIAADLRTMREGRDLAQRAADLRARRETQALARWREALRSEAKWRETLRRSKAQAWVGSEDASQLWQGAPCACGSDTQAQAQRRGKAQAQRTEWSNGARLTWRPFSGLALALAQAQARVAQ